MVSVVVEKVIEKYAVFGSVAMRVILSRLCGKIVAGEDELSVPSESVGLVRGVLVRREVSICAEEELSSEARYLVLSSTTRPSSSSSI